MEQGYRKEKVEKTLNEMFHLNFCKNIALNNL